VSADEAPRFPRGVEEDPRCERLAAELVSRGQRLWPGGRLRVARAEFDRKLEAALSSAFASGLIVRGFEEADRALDAEARGLAQVDRRTGAPRGRRVSRLLVLSDDGAERFYRSVESLLVKHAPRVLALRLAVDQHALGERVFGPDQVARLLLIERKQAVSELLLALAEQWSETTAPA